ncbi:glycosyl-4,4'-diaponeurosporenoate acyltransferase [Metabacillus sp. 84]|uniref:glycosyl-4,4'-diaponeurosporenoate acyltransferase CrtO family protein n=1 Tax=unclassified Metabacillus TaxID=2675274 RepID=UPI003CF420BF
MTALQLITLNVFLLLVIPLVTSWLISLIPANRFEASSLLYKRRKWEQDGRLYERFLIKKWKDKLPEAGGWFNKGFSKRSLKGSDTAGLKRFIAETRRGELAHWLQMLPCFFFFYWNSLAGGLVIALYAIVFNLPFIAVQRYNRIRLERTLFRKRTNDEMKQGKAGEG